LLIYSREMGECNPLPGGVLWQTLCVEEDLLVSILTLLDAKSLLSVELSCTVFRNFIIEREIWKKAYRRNGVKYVDSFTPHPDQESSPHLFFKKSLTRSHRIEDSPMAEIMRMMNNPRVSTSGGRGRGARFQEFYKPPALPTSHHISEAVGTAHRLPLRYNNKKKDNFILSSLETESESSSSQISKGEGSSDGIDVSLDRPIPNQEINRYYGVARESPYRAWLESLPSLPSSRAASVSGETASTVEIEDDDAKATDERNSGEYTTPIEDRGNGGLNARDEVIATSKMKTPLKAGRHEKIIADEVLEKIQNLNISR